MLHNDVNESVTRSNLTLIKYTVTKFGSRERTQRNFLNLFTSRKKGPNLNRDNGLDLDPFWDKLSSPKRPGGTRTECQSIFDITVNCDIKN